MKRILGRVVVVCVSAIVLGAVTPACVENDQTIFIRSVLAPSINRQQGTCIYTSDPQQAILFEGLLDVGVRDNYFTILLVGNQSIQRGDPNTARAEPNRAHLNGAIVRVSDLNGNTLAEFTSPATGFADIAQNNNPGYGVMAVVGIDAPTAASFRDQLRLPDGSVDRTARRQVLLNMKAYGRTLGGLELESSEYQFPLRICNGCLVNFGTADPARPPGEQCAGTLAAGGTGAAQLPCFVGQDEATPCQLCQSQDVCKL